MHSIILQYRKLSLSWPLAAGIVWGMTEFLFGTVLKSYFPNGAIGSALAGASVFFLMIGISQHQRFIYSACVSLMAITFKITAAAIMNIPVMHQCVVSPVLAIGIQSVVFLAFIHMVPVNSKLPLTRQALYGTAIATISAIAFPLVQLAANQTICLKSGSAIPLSFYYLHYTIIFGAISIPAATGFMKRFNSAR